MWFTSSSAVFAQADPPGRSRLIFKSGNTTSTEAAETLKGRLKIKLNVEKILCLCLAAYKTYQNITTAFTLFTLKT